MSGRLMRTQILILMTVGALAGTLAFGQDSDPPGRAARLSYVSGSVSFQPGGVEDWVEATLNRPLTTGDRLWTESGARAELNIGSAAFRLNGRTNFAFLNLDDTTAQIQISLGTLSVRLRRLAEDETFEIDTPQAAFSLLRPGEYRIDVNEQGDTTIVTVRGGEGEATAGGQAFAVHAREQVRITGTEQPSYDRRDVPPADSFDNWCMDRDRREDRSQSARYVSRDMPGYADLDDHGAWRTYPDYGPVWVPSGVPIGWAPYRFGHWAWIAPWGWTWVDDTPWGYAPFHYGRWVFVGGYWGWVPGPVVVRPVYAPALVAWVGGSHLSVGIAIGGAPTVGWFPLAPHEVWVPAYRASPRYFTRVNETNTVVNNVNITNVYNNVYVNKTNVTNVRYVNQNVNGAVTAVPQNAMVSGRAVSQAALRVPPGAVANAEIQHAPLVAPERSAVVGGRALSNAAPPAAIANRAVVAKAAPPPPPVPFSQQQSVLRANPGRPLDAGTVNQMQRSVPAQASRPMIRPASPSAPAARFGTPPNTDTQAPPPEMRRQNTGGTPQQPEMRRNNAPPPVQQQPPVQHQQPEFRCNPTPPPAQSQPQPEIRRNTPPAVQQPQPAPRSNTPPPERHAAPPPEMRREDRQQRREEKQQQRRDEKQQKREEKERKQQL